jgi:FSR family fosmidomycin resistance protein-like MFS transporter
MDNITAESLPLAEITEDEFQTDEILTISGGHFLHDIYTGFLSPLLPVIIEKLSLSLTAAGSLNAILQLPALLNPFIGYLADQISLRYFIILAPAVTGTLISLMGLAPSYLTLALILFMTGFSVAAFHAPAPAMIGRISGKQVGKGMSFFMAGGELARTVSPLIAVWAVSLWTIDGIYRMAVLGWATSLVLFWRLHSISARPNLPGNIRSLIPVLRSVFPPLLVIIFFRNFLNVGLAIYLPTYMKFGGSSLWAAGAALSVYELAGVAGALSSGTLSDRLGRKPVLSVGIVSAAALMLIFLNVEGWLIVPLLLALGFTALSIPPVLMAIVQEHLPNNRALGNGLFISISFLIRPISILFIGLIGDTYDLRTAYYLSAIISLLAIPAIFKIPNIKPEA